MTRQATVVLSLASLSVTVNPEPVALAHASWYGRDQRHENGACEWCGRGAKRENSQPGQRRLSIFFNSDTVTLQGTLANHTRLCR